MPLDSDDNKMSQEEFLKKISDLSSPRPSPMVQPAVMAPDDGRMSQDDFLKYISQIESSGGKNTKHPEVTSGVNAGDRAVGQYGLMPNTIRDTVKRGLASGELPRNMAGLSSHGADLSNIDPASESAVANALAHRVLNKYQDPNMAAYAWNQGTSLSPDQIKQRDFMNSNYVQKFNKVRKLMGK